MTLLWLWILLMAVNLAFSMAEVIEAPMLVALTYLTTILCVQLSRNTSEKRIKEPEQ